MENWSRRVPDLKAELSRRNLPKTGFKGALVARLNHTNTLPITVDGRKSAYVQQIREFRERSLAQVKSVNFFGKLPPEIRQHVYIDQRGGGVLRQELRKFESLKRVYLCDDGRKKTNDLFCGHPSIEDQYFEKRPKVLPRNIGGPMVGYIGDDPTYDEWKKRNMEVRDHAAALGVLATWDLKDLSSEETEKGNPVARIVEMEWVVDEPCRIREIGDFQ
ncbi:hypothetical protein BKA61DRAFT_718596 [Leptodontidium sp. MPI-SDFR-AT-0119]|nr:hypothetical protein BKA61DRAFT_718596 [Leptodontidium sp. MPI-SDFR-AT-0119]